MSSISTPTTDAGNEARHAALNGQAAAPAGPAPPTAPTPLAPPAVGVRARRGWWGWGWVESLVLAAIAYAPLLSVRRGVVTPDTKTYLYLDPARFLHQVASMWNPTVGLGTVNHEYIGYLLPMGPFFWFFHAVGIPVWVAQRLWLGSILFAAGMGVRYLSKVFGLEGAARVSASLVFMLSPYVLQYAGRISVILLPWAGLPWMVAFAAMALRRPGWRYPALFAIVVALVSGINASSIIYVGVAPVLWIVYAVAVERQTTWRTAAVVVLRIGLLTLLVCVWWIAGLQVEAAYGVNVLRYTETLPTTSSTANPSEVIRGLGYWYFYDGDRLGPWTPASSLYTQYPLLLTISYLVPALGFLSAAFVRWRHRAFYILLVVVGLVLSVGAYPFADPTPFGKVLKAFMSDTTAGLAMRSTDRATPLVVLGLAMLVGAGVSAVWHRMPWLGAVTALVVCGLALANNPAIFNGDTIANDFTQPAHLPAPEMQAINHLNAVHPGTRVLGIPGDDFSSYRWGNTVDTPQPAYLDRPFVIHEQQVMGSIATADTLYALDDPIQENVENWSALAPMARLLSAGDILVENDTQYEHYGIPHPQLLALQLAQTPRGLSDPVSFGTPVPNVSQISTLDEADLAAPADVAWPAPVVTYTVDGPRPISRAESDTGALVVAGDAVGLQDIAGTGLLDTDSAIYYAGTLDTQPARLHQLLDAQAALVVTDTNRKQGFRWTTISANTGITETPTQNLAKNDPTDSPINLFPRAPITAHTTSSTVGAVSVTASSYGNPVSYTPENRPASAIDDNLDTAWETGTFVPDPAGQWWQVQFANPVTTDRVNLIQVQRGVQYRHITRVTLTFDGKDPVTQTLGPASRASTGQGVSFGFRTFHTLRITIDATSDDHEPSPSATAVGFAEVQVPGQHVVEVVDMPSDLLSEAGAASLFHRLTLVMTRLRTDPTSPRLDPESHMVRQFTLPTPRTFTLSGLASISPLVADDVVDRLVGRSAGVTAYSTGRLPGDLLAGAQAAADGNPATAWQPGFGNFQLGDWLHYDLPKPITFDHMDLQVVADGRHSVPTALTVATEHGFHRVVLPPIADGRTPGSTVTVPISFAPLTGAHLVVTITGVRAETTTNYSSSTPIELPLGIAEVGIPGVRVGTVPALVPGNCQPGLISVDDQPVDVRVVGSSATALANGDLPIVPCGPNAGGITLGPGAHVLQTALGHTTGWNIDQVVLDSAPGGAAAPPPASGNFVAATQPGPAPTVTVQSQNATNITTSVRGATGPFEYVLGQSINSGWTAEAVPGPGAPPGASHLSLGPPTLVDGFANGWAVSTRQLTELGAIGVGGSATFAVVLRWAPQRQIWLALGISALALVTCVFLACYPRRWRRGRTRHRARHAARSVPTAGMVPVMAAAGAAPVTSAAPVVTAAGAAPVMTTATTATGSAAAGPAAGPATMTTGPSAAALPVPPAPVAAPAVDPDRSPTLALPFTPIGGRPAWWAIALVSLVTGAVAAAISSPRIGAGALLATAVALVVPRLRSVISFLALGLLVAAATEVVRWQQVHRLPVSGNWPGMFSSEAVLVWMAVVFLGVDAVVESARRRAKRQPGNTQPEPAADVPPGSTGLPATAPAAAATAAAVAAAPAPTAPAPAKPREAEPAAPDGAPPPVSTASAVPAESAEPVDALPASDDSPEPSGSESTAADAESTAAEAESTAESTATGSESTAAEAESTATEAAVSEAAVSEAAVSEAAVSEAAVSEAAVSEAAVSAAAETAAAETGSAETGSAETGSADAGSAETGSAETAPPAESAESEAPGESAVASASPESAASVATTAPEGPAAVEERDTGPSDATQDDGY